MSDDIRTGRKARKILTIMAAVFAVAMMLAVPVFTAVDTDAAFTNDSAGYNIALTNPTDAQMTKIGMDKADSLMEAIGEEMELFNTSGLDPVFGEPTVTADTFEYTEARGEKITDDKYTSVITGKISSTNVKIKMDVTENGKLISPDQLLWTDKQKAAASAIALFIGENVYVGDKVEITGTIKEEVATQTEITFKLLNDNKCVYSKEAISAFAVEDIDLTLKMTRVADGSSKEIKLVSTVKGTYTIDSEYKYKEDEVKVGTKYDFDASMSPAISGDICYKVDGKDYSIYDEPSPPTSLKNQTVRETDIFDQSSISISFVLKHRIDLLPDSEEGMKVEKGYDAAQSAFDGVVMDAVGNDLLKLILIIIGVVIGVIVLIVILIIVVIVLKKKKK